MSVAKGRKARFDVQLDREPWDEVRVGVVWHPGGQGKDPPTAWSRPVGRNDVKQK